MSTPDRSTDTYLRTELLERIAHELRGPVGVTTGALDEIELALGPDAEKLQVYFLMARRGLRRVLRTADRLQRTALLESESVVWAKVPTDLRRLAEEATKEVELLEARRGIRVEVSCSDEACSVVTDPDWMRVAIAEVVGNAIRYASSLVSVRTAPSPTEVLVTVTDDGPGFSAPVPRRFEAATEKRGVGLSLPLVGDVLASQGGRIEIGGASADGSDAPGGGRVVFALPRVGGPAT